MLGILARGTGAAGGICAGQAWESEGTVDLSRYHQAKTGALFVTSIGEAYQVADDIQDKVSSSDELGKPCHRDEDLDRPSAVKELGVQGAARRLKELIELGLDSVPECPGRNQLLNLVRAQAQGFLPKGLGLRAA